MCIHTRTIDLRSEAWIARVGYRVIGRTAVSPDAVRDRAPDPQFSREKPAGDACRSFLWFGSRLVRDHVFPGPAAAARTYGFLKILFSFAAASFHCWRGARRYCWKWPARRADRRRAALERFLLLPSLRRTRAERPPTGAIAWNRDFDKRIGGGDGNEIRSTLLQAVIYSTADSRRSGGLFFFTPPRLLDHACFGRAAKFTAFRIRVVSHF